MNMKKLNRFNYRSSDKIGHFKFDNYRSWDCYSCLKSLKIEEFLTTYPAAAHPVNLCNQPTFVAE